MIYVHVILDLLPGAREAYLEAVQELGVESRLEEGCLEYVVTVEHPLPLALSRNFACDASSPSGSDHVVLVEKWDDLEFYERHFSQPHFDVYLGKVKHLIRRVEMRILEPAARLESARRDRVAPR